MTIIKNLTRRHVPASFAMAAIVLLQSLLIPAAIAADCWRLENGDIVDFAKYPGVTPPSNSQQVACPATSLQFVPRECPGNSYFNGQVCACAEGTKWDGEMCQLIPGYQPPNHNQSTKLPVEGPVLLTYGEYLPMNRSQRNGGLRIQAKGGTPVHVVSAGVVSKVKKISNHEGFVVVIAEPQGGAKAYLHMAPRVYEGDEVKVGQVLGRVWSDQLQFNACQRLAFCEQPSLPDVVPDPSYPGLPLFNEGPFLPVQAGSFGSP